MTDKQNMAAVIIPARLGSTRFPNKPLAKILGVPMIELIYQHASGSHLASAVAVATCDPEIMALIQERGGKAIMTSDAHTRATDRTAEALLILEESEGVSFEIVVMLQGDEPTVSPAQIDSVIEALMSDKSIDVVNLWGPMASVEELLDSNCIKVVADLNNDALYFSRNPIPHGADFSDPSVGKQVCAIGFRRDYLLRYLALAPTSLEILESVDMNRILQHGDKVKLVKTDSATQPVDEPHDIPRVEEILNGEKWHAKIVWGEE
jgi:3-deoxy-manno-octulosonate cytidylyltransferase (CMP-KDO synthetase)